MNKERINQFFPLLGSKGILPHHYTEAVFEQLEKNNTSLLDFYNIFNHRARALSQEVFTLIDNFKADWLGTERRFFCYYSLFIFGLCSKQAFQQFLIAYFNLNCYQIQLKTISIKTKKQKMIYLGKNSWLGSQIKTSNLELHCYFSSLHYQNYLELVLSSDFWSELKELAHIYRIPDRHLKLYFEVNFDSHYPCHFHHYFLGRNSWLELKPNKLPLSKNIVCRPSIAH